MNNTKAAVATAETASQRQKENSRGVEYIYKRKKNGNKCMEQTELIDVKMEKLILNLYAL